MVLEYKASYRSFVANYLLAGLVAVFIIMLYSQYNLVINFAPRSVYELLSSFLIISFIAIILFLIEEPTIKRILFRYSITENEIIKMEGILRKKKIAIPLQNIADVKIEKGIIGRIFNFGNVEVSGFKNSITMFGLENPEEVYRIIKNKISLVSKTQKTKKEEE